MAESFACPQCGAQITSTTRFCPECGYPVQAEFYQTSRPAGPVPPTQRMDDSGFESFTPGGPVAGEPVFDSAAPKQRSRTGLFIGIGVALVACCFIAGALVLFSTLLDGDTLSFLASATPTQTPVTPTPTSTNTPIPPTATATFPSPPTQPAVQPSPENGFTGSQSLTDTQFYDDFSSKALEWAESADESSTLAYENGAYAINLLTNDYRHLSRPPLQDLNRLDFNATVASNPENGVFGVACYYKDIDNYHFVEMDMSNRTYHFGEFKDGTWTSLSDWTSLPSGAANARFGIDCTPGLMALYVNDQLVGQQSVSQPADLSQMWIYAMSWTDAGSGIKVIFDDVSGYKAMQ